MRRITDVVSELRSREASLAQALIVAARADAVAQARSGYDVVVEVDEKADGAKARVAGADAPWADLDEAWLAEVLTPASGGTRLLRVNGWPLFARLVKKSGLSFAAVDRLVVQLAASEGGLDRTTEDATRALMATIGFSVDEFALPAGQPAKDRLLAVASRPAAQPTPPAKVAGALDISGHDVALANGYVSGRIRLAAPAAGRVFVAILAGDAPISIAEATPATGDGAELSFRIWAAPELFAAAERELTVAAFAAPPLTRVATLARPAGRRFAPAAFVRKAGPMRGRLVICDYNLADERGHHLNVANSLARAARMLGIDCAALTHRRLAPGLLDAGATAHPLFPTSFYEARTPEGRPRDVAPELSAGLEKAASDGLLDGADLLIHTGDAHLARALGATLGVIAARGATVHFATPYDPDVMPGGLGPGGCDRAMRHLFMRDEANRSILFWAETPPLAEFYSRVYGVETAHLPMPSPDWTQGDMPAGAPGELTLSFFGAAREEKGFLKLPAIVEAVRARPPEGLKVDFRIQVSAPIAGMTDPIAETVARLRDLAGVTLIESALSEADYAREMFRADVVLLPYDGRKYAVRGSGVAVEALSLGKILVAPPGTFIDAVAPPGLVVRGETPDEWATGLFRLIAERRGAPRSAALDRAVAAFRAERTGEAYIRRLFARRDGASLVESGPLRSARPGSA